MKNHCTIFGLLLLLRLIASYPLDLTYILFQDVKGSWHQLVVQPYRDRT